jgi:hypothetical protein
MLGSIMTYISYSFWITLMVTMARSSELKPR